MAFIKLTLANTEKRPCYLDAFTITAFFQAENCSIVYLDAQDSASRVWYVTEPVEEIASMIREARR